MNLQHFEETIFDKVIVKCVQREPKLTEIETSHSQRRVGIFF